MSTKKILLIVLLIICLSISIVLTVTKCQSTQYKLESSSYIQEKGYNPTTNNISGITIQKLSGEIPKGLYRIKVSDSTTLLIYRGTESITMIKE